ncbi:MAG TPA: response regulator, partial [Xanthobacteraceae bacterium]|nr:response regulator [Xanthobacteraceae bacterium]
MIVIVDDDESMREATKFLVISLGYSVLTFASAEEYLASDHVSATSCLISDLRMPGMSGVELQKRLIADGHRIPMIFVTAFFNEQVRARALQAGALGFLSKPFEDRCLIKCLDKALKSDTADF